MITPDERTQLELIETSEMDFYAGCLVLALGRIERARETERFRVVPLDMIREVVTGVYADLNEDMERMTSEPD